MQIEGLCFTYRGGGANRNLFEDFKFSCDEPIAILCGRSGCGKTTLLKLLAGLLRPQGSKTFAVPRDARMVLQEDALFPWLTVRENLAIAMRGGRLQLDARLLEPIKHLRDRLVCELSYGQRRLVELCRSFSGTPSLLCLDEPFNFLDPEARMLMAELISVTTAESQRQVVLTTHHQEDVEMFKAAVFRFPEVLPLRELIRGT